MPNINPPKFADYFRKISTLELVWGFIRDTGATGAAGGVAGAALAPVGVAGVAVVAEGAAEGAVVPPGAVGARSADAGPVGGRGIDRSRGAPGPADPGVPVGGRDDSAPDVPPPPVVAGRA